MKHRSAEPWRNFRGWSSDNTAEEPECGSEAYSKSTGRSDDSHDSHDRPDKAKRPPSSEDGLFASTQESREKLYSGSRPLAICG